MLKRLLSFCVCFLVLFSQVAFAASAANVDDEQNTETYTTYFEDGSYRITTITKYPTSSIGRAATQYINGRKTVADYNSSGTQLYSLTVLGSFTYNGATSKATYSSYSYTIDNPNWKFVSGSSSYSGSSATATATFKYVLSLTLDVTLSCSPTGTLS